MRRLVVLTLTAILLGIAGLLAWASVTERASYVVTTGVSMQPVYHAGDLVVVAKKDSYRVGDIVAYRAQTIIVLHRIIGGDADGFITQGDNNESVDPDRPTSADLLGRAVLHVPGAGTWLRRASSPPVIAAVVFFIVLGGGKVVRRRGRRGAMHRRHASSTQGVPSGPVLTSVMSSPRLRVAAAAIAALGLIGIMLGFVAWRLPLTTTVDVKAPPGPSMTFSYAATVPVTPAYDGTTVVSPDPVFRKVAKSLDVTYVYTGPPGRVQVDARLSTANGWRTTVPLVAETSFTGAGYRGVVPVNLDLLDARARAGSEATGTRATEVTVAVVPTVTAESGAVFAPSLQLKLTPLALTATGPFVTRDNAEPSTSVVPEVVHIAGLPVGPVPVVRVASAVLLLGAVLAVVPLTVLARRVRPVPEAERLRRQYRKLLVEVRPIDPPPGRPVVHLADFKTLARLAERYGLLVLYWSTAESTTFAVHDDTATYWYSPESAATEAVEPTEDTDTSAAEGAGALDVADPPAPADTDVPEAADAPVTDGTHATDSPFATDSPHSTDSLYATYAPEADDPLDPDALTSLASGPLFEAAAQSALDASGGERACLLLIGLDDAPTMAQTHGPEIAEAVLVAIAERLRQTVRPGDLVACLGADRFAVLFEDVRLPVVDQVAKRMMRNVNEPLVVRGVQVRVRANIGVAQAGTAKDARVLMERATAALVEARAAAEEQVAWFAEVTGQSSP